MEIHKFLFFVGMESIKKRNLWIEIPIVIVVCTFIILSIAVLERALFYEPFIFIWAKWIYCACTCITAIGFLFYFSRYRGNKNTQRIFFLLVLIFCNTGIVCELYINPQFYWLDLLFDATFGISFVLLIIHLILILLYYCTRTTEPVMEV